jgi:hypothetical protein
MICAESFGPYEWRRRVNFLSNRAFKTRADTGGGCAQAADNSSPDIYICCTLALHGVQVVACSNHAAPTNNQALGPGRSAGVSNPPLVSNFGPR